MKILITAGPTREFIDDVRFLSNPSSGKMGISIAEKALERGWEVYLILGPTHLSPPREAETISVISTCDMYDATHRVIQKEKPETAVLSAAPCDFRPRERISGKVKKGSRDNFQLDMVKNPDILASLGDLEEPPVLAGFALESENLAQEAQRKVKEKKVDFIVANSPQTFASSHIEATFFFRDGTCDKVGKVTKKELAGTILDKLEKEVERRKKKA